VTAKWKALNMSANGWLRLIQKSPAVIDSNWDFNMIKKLFTSIFLLWNLPIFILAFVLSPWLLDDLKTTLEKFK